MSFPKRLLRLSPNRGFVSDIPANQVGPEFYTGAQNVIFRRGFANRVKSHRDAYVDALGVANPIQLFHLINSANPAGINFWVVIEQDGSAWGLVGAAAQQVDNGLLSAISSPSDYSSTLLNGLPIITNGDDEPVYHDFLTSGVFQLLPDWTATESAKFIVAFQFHIFAMDISGPGGIFPNLVKWSDAAEPGTVPSSWTPDPSNTAGNVELADGKGPVLCAIPLKNTLIFYKQTQSYGAQFVGGNQIFSFQPLNRSAGALNRHSVVDIGERHLVVEQGDIVLSDGVNRQSIGQSRVKDFLFNQLSQENFRNLSCTFYQPTSEVYIAFPSEGSTFADLALVYNISSDSFGIRDLPNIEHMATGFVTDDPDEAPVFWDDDSEVWDLHTDDWNSASILAAAESLVFARLDDIELQNALNGPLTITESFVGKHDLTFGEPERLKAVKRVHILAEPGFFGLFVRIGSRMTPTDTINWSPETFMLEPEQIVNTFAIGRYISVEIRSSGTREWVLNAIELEAELRGYH